MHARHILLTSLPLILVAWGVTGCGANGTNKDQASETTKALTEKSGRATDLKSEYLSLLPNGDCFIPSSIASSILGVDVEHIPTPGAICAFGVSSGGIADLDKPILSFGVVPSSSVDPAAAGLEEHPNWGDGALYEKQGCRGLGGCTANAFLPNRRGFVFVSAGSGADGSEATTESYLDALIGLLKK